MDNLYAVFSDVHGNYEALKAVLREITDTHKVSTNNMIALGDIVGYIPSPNESLDLLRNLNIDIVKGNHEVGCYDDKELYYWNEIPRIAICKTRELLREDNLKFIKELPYLIRKEDMAFTHGTYNNPQVLMYLDSDMRAATSFRYMNGEGVKILFVGHTHKPCIWECILGYEERLSFRSVKLIKDVIDKPYTMKDNRLYIVNVGSVGQSRNDIAEAFYCLYDKENGMIELKHTPYDIDLAAAKVREHGLPEVLAERLYIGK